MARSLANLGDRAEADRPVREADEASARAVGLAEALVAEAPRDPHFRSDLAHDLDERANLLRLLGRPREAEAVLLRACDVAERLANDFPSFNEYQDLHSTIRRDLAILFGSRGQFQDARRDMARAHRRRGGPGPQATPTCRPPAGAGGPPRQPGRPLHSAGRPAEAEREYREALRLAEALAAEHPGLLDYRALRASYRSSIAFLLRATGRYLEAESAYEEVVAELEALRREFPELPQFRAGLASACNQRGAVLDLLKRPREAESSLERAIDLAEGLAAEFPGVPPTASRPPRPSPRSRNNPSIDGETDAGRRFNERAIRHMESVLAGDPESSSHRFLLTRTTSALAQFQAREGDGRAVDASARRIEDLPRSPIEHYNAACFLSLVLRAVRGGKLPEAERDALARSLADRAMAQLTRAIDEGYRNIGLMRKDPDLDPLRSREDFQPLLDRVEAEMAKGK